LKNCRGLARDWSFSDTGNKWAFTWKDSEKPVNLSIRIDGIQAEIRNGNPLNFTITGIALIRSKIP
jgi:hypothetical protein